MMCGVVQLRMTIAAAVRREPGSTVARTRVAEAMHVRQLLGGVGAA